jgi:hypothetical protein
VTQWSGRFLFLIFVRGANGIGSRSWFGREKKIRWEDVASLHFNLGNRFFVGSQMHMASLRIPS